jgi:hypothetical protein
MRADAELRTGDGQVWCQIEGWTTRRFATNEAIWNVKLQPGINTLARLCPGGWNAVREAWPDMASRDLIMRRYLNASERAHYERLTPRQQREWLLRAMAAKDAVRRWLWDRGCGPVYPAEVTVQDAGAGVRVSGPFRAPQVSVASRLPPGAAAGGAIAIVGDQPVDFSVDLDHDNLFITQPGREPRLIEACAPAGALQTEGHS